MNKVFKILIILSTFLLLACNKNKKVQVEEKKEIKYIQVSEVKEREISSVFESNIILESEEKVNHSTERGGVIEKIYKTNGDFVKKGEIIVELSDPLTETAYLQAKANLQTANFNFNIAKAKYEKFKNLYDKELISFLEFSQYETTFSSAKGNLEIARANFQSAKNDYDKLKRVADINGIVGNLFAKVGNKVVAKETLFTVVNNEKMQAYVGVNAEAISKISKGDSLKINVPALNRDYEGLITELNPIADKITKNFIIKLSLDNKEKNIKDGMYANVRINIGKRNVLTIEDEAIFMKELLNYVYKYENGKVKQIEVEKGAVNLPFAEIKSEKIKTGDKIVVKGLFGLQDNDDVEIKEEVGN